MTQILITGDGTHVIKKGELTVGKKYIIQEESTISQNSLFHALVDEWYVSGLHSYSNCDKMAFRDLIKRDYGEGFSEIVYATPEGIKKAKVIDDVPVEFRGKHCLGRLKSWSDYSKTQRRDTIDRLIKAMIQTGVNSPKFDEIINGAME